MGKEDHGISSEGSYRTGRAAKKVSDKGYLFIIVILKVYSQSKVKTFTDDSTFCVGLVHVCS